MSGRIACTQVSDGTASDRQRRLFEIQVQSVEGLQEQVDYFKSINNKNSLILARCGDGMGRECGELLSPLLPRNPRLREEACKQPQVLGKIPKTFLEMSLRQET